MRISAATIAPTSGLWLHDLSGPERLPTLPRSLRVPDLSASLGPRSSVPTGHRRNGQGPHRAHGRPGPRCPAGSLGSGGSQGHPFFDGPFERAHLLPVPVPSLAALCYQRLGSRMEQFLEPLAAWEGAAQLEPAVREQLERMKVAHRWQEEVLPPPGRILTRRARKGPDARTSKSNHAFGSPYNASEGANQRSYQTTSRCSPMLIFQTQL